VTPPDPGGEGFARRWSRLKRAAPATTPEPPAEPQAGPPPEPIEPPPAEDVPLDDILSWVRRGAPQLWAQTALRRLWASDPTISSFIGPADYAWDWNAADAVPGWGPMRVADDLGKLLSRAIGEPMAPRPDLGPPAEPEAVPPPELAQIPEPPPDQEPPKSPEAASPPESPPHRRRGGGATPV
jgi:hypothetical protein